MKVVWFWIFRSYCPFIRRILPLAGGSCGHRQITDRYLDPARILISAAESGSDHLLHFVSDKLYPDPVGCMQLMVATKPGLGPDPKGHHRLFTMTNLDKHELTEAEY